MQSYFRKKPPILFLVEEGKRHYALYYLFRFLEVSSLTFVVQTMTFQLKLLNHFVFKSHTVWL